MSFPYDEGVCYELYGLLPECGRIGSYVLIVSPQMAVVHSLKQHLVYGRDQRALAWVEHAALYALVDHELV